MNREEWLEYFEAVNGRQATAEEEQAAISAGEFIMDPADAKPKDSGSYQQPDLNQGFEQSQPLSHQPSFEQAPFFQQGPVQGATNAYQQADFQQGQVTGGQAQAFDPNFAYQQQAFAQQQAYQQQANAQQQQAAYQQQAFQQGPYQQANFQQGNPQAGFPYQQYPNGNQTPFNIDIEARKAQLNNYWNWLVDAWKAPSKEVKASNSYIAVTFALLAFLFGIAFLWTGASVATTLHNIFQSNYSPFFSAPKVQSSTVIGNFTIKEYVSFMLVASVFLFGFILSTFIGRYLVYGESKFNLSYSFKWFNRRWSILIPVFLAVAVFSLIGFSNLASILLLMSIVYIFMVSVLSLLNPPTFRKLDAVYIYSIASVIVILVFVFTIYVNAHLVYSIVGTYF